MVAASPLLGGPFSYLKRTNTKLSQRATSMVEVHRASPLSAPPLPPFPVQTAGQALGEEAGHCRVVLGCFSFKPFRVFTEPVPLYQSAYVPLSGVLRLTCWEDALARTALPALPL